MSENLFDPPASYLLPLSRGQDLEVVFESAWPPGSRAKLVIDSDPPLIADAVVDESVARVLVRAELVDNIKRGVTWRLVATRSDHVDVVVANGLTGRFDGKPAMP